VLKVTDSLISVLVGSVREYPAFKKLESHFCQLFFLFKNGLSFHKRNTKSNDSRLLLSSDGFFGSDVSEKQRPRSVTSQKKAICTVSRYGKLEFYRAKHIIALCSLTRGLT
jgi:hypothetical protein